MDKTIFRLKFENNSDGKKYKVEAICISVVYATKTEDHLPGLYCVEKLLKRRKYLGANISYLTLLEVC